ncbi:hypothetical protein AC249_AIPGENE14579 [Exaiptasia diaphana]|nr:hypothetical protein AC249_AIPGENE14579 [Exaiptasia diaphana]
MNFYQAPMTLARLARLSVRQGLLSRNSAQRIINRGLFYTQRKRPSTPEENLVMVTGLASAIAMIGLGCNMGVFSIRYGMQDKPQD